MTASLTFVFLVSDDLSFLLMLSTIMSGGIIIITSNRKRAIVSDEIELFPPERQHKAPLYSLYQPTLNQHNYRQAQLRYMAQRQCLVPLWNKQQNHIFKS